MGQFSIEPPRRSCIRHYTFNYLNGDRLVDLSPQGSDGNIAGGSIEQITGAIGNAGRLNEARIEAGDVGSHDEFTVSFWIKREEPLDQDPNRNEYQHVSKAGTDQFIVAEEDHSISFYLPGIENSPLTGGSFDVGEWAHVACVYDGEDRRIYVDGDLVAADNVGSGTASIGNLQIGEDGEGINNADFGIDAFRFYRTGLSSEQVSALHQIGTAHQHVDEMGEAWDNRGMPYIRGKGNANLASTLGEQDDLYMRNLDYVVEARHITDAAGEQLDRIGQVAGVRRRENEQDDQYRARIIGTIAAARSDGTFESIINATASILETTVEEITIQREWENDPTNGVGTIRIYVNKSDIDKNDLTRSDIGNIIEETVAAGHSIRVLVQDAPPFLLTDDQSANQPEHGLTSDSTTVGGRLAEDL